MSVMLSQENGYIVWSPPTREVVSQLTTTGVAPAGEQLVPEVQPRLTRVSTEVQPNDRASLDVGPTLNFTDPLVVSGQENKKMNTDTKSEIFRFIIYFNLSEHC